MVDGLAALDPVKLLTAHWRGASAPLPWGDEMAHTPGPWITNGGQIETEQGVYNGGIIATVGIVNHQDATDIANARLIAQSPAMYDSLKELLHYAETPGDFIEEEVKNVLEYGAIVLAKVEGGE